MDTLQIEMNEQLEGFRALLDFSEKWLDKMDSMPVTVIGEMLDYRQQWIESFNETRQRWVRAETVDLPQKKQFVQEMSRIAGELVKVDEKIHQTLEDRKRRYLGMLADTHATRKQADRAKNNAAPYGKRVDIVQE